MQLNTNRFFNLVYSFLIDGASQEDIDKFDRRLAMPPPSERKKVQRRGPWSAEAEQNALGGLVAALGSSETKTGSKVL